MKHNSILFLLILSLLAAISPAAFAAESLPMVVDNAELLSSTEESALETSVQELREAYEMDFVLLTANSLEGKSAQEYADDYFDENGYGYGENGSGVLFLLAMEEREWYISTCGDAIYALTDYGVQELGETAVWYFSEGYYAEGFQVFLSYLPDYLDAYESGTPLDGYADYSGDYYHGDRETVVHYEKETSPNILISLLIGAGTAVVAVLIMRSSMNTKKMQYGASSYLKSGTFSLRKHQDMFLYSNVSKVRRQQNNSSGGGSSVHRSSGGRRHGGGGGRF